MIIPEDLFKNFSNVKTIEDAKGKGKVEMTDLDPELVQRLQGCGSVELIDYLTVINHSLADNITLVFFLVQYSNSHVLFNILQKTCLLDQSANSF